MKTTSYRAVNTLWVLFFIFSIATGVLRAQQSPRTYTAQKTQETITIDGKVSESAWQNAKWSQSFIDIEGDKTPKYDTKMKMIWDDTYLYIYAELNEPHVWGTLKQRDTVVFYNNDFEVFIDPDGDTHNYYEIEVNALNTIWDLYLSKPYRNGAQVLNNYDIAGLQSAVHVNGTLNNPTDTDDSWAVEMAIPWSFTTGGFGTVKAPVNKFWRINFSRVHWDHTIYKGRYHRTKANNGTYLPAYNWVWSPQGVINMHEPEHWGYVYFATEDNAEDVAIPKDEHIKWYLYELYRAYSAKENSDTLWQKDGDEYTTAPKTIFGSVICPVAETYAFGYSIWVKSPFTGDTLVVHDDGRFEQIVE